LISDCATQMIKQYRKICIYFQIFELPRPGLGIELASFFALFSGQKRYRRKPDPLWVSP
jgi:hypothetical protein